VPPPVPPLTPEDTWNLDLSTGGRVVIQLRSDVAPRTVERIKTLTRQGFYNGLTFHRVIENFMAQGGDPRGNGTGGSTLPDLPAEINGLPHLRGSVAMARAQDPNSANSQFYIMFAPHLAMDRSYTVFGRVVSGMNFVDAIHRGEPPANPSRIVRASIGSDNVPPMSAAELEAAGAPPPAAAAAPVPGIPTIPQQRPGQAPGGTEVGPVMPQPGVPRQPEPPQPQRRRGN
jgi:peptidylprolyl isomerase